MKIRSDGKSLMRGAVSEALASGKLVTGNGSSEGPIRNARQAVLKAQEYINSGSQHIVDIDLKSFPPAGGLTIVSCCNYCIVR